MSTTDILLNSAALNSLKRNQLVSLCKMHGLKANGKNSDLIDKLQEYAMNNPKRERGSAGLPGLAQQMSDAEPGGGSDDMGMNNEENEGRARMRPSEIWEVIEEETVEEMRKIQEESLNSKGSYQSHRSKASQKLPGEFGAASTLMKTSSVGSSLKSLASSFKWGSSKGTSQTSQHLSMPVESEIEPTINEDVQMADISIELDHQTVRLVTTFNPQSSYPSPPPLRAFRPSLPLAPLSPDPKAPLYPPLPPKELLYTPVKPSPLSFGVHASPTPATPKLPSEPFIFGSPAPRHSVSNAEFGAAANSVLEEMNRRLGMKGGVPLPSTILAGRELGKAQEIIDSAEKAKAEILAARPMMKRPARSRFSDAHSKEFAKMESIVDYAARRNGDTETLGPIERKRKSNVFDNPSNQRLANAGMKRSGMPGGFGGDYDEEGDEAIAPKAKRARISEAPGRDAGEAPRVKIADTEQVRAEETDKEKDAIKRKLEASRARRRSSRGRPSVGGRPSLVRPAPQAKKGVYSRFGFLKGAVGAVKNVWNRGAGAPTTTTKAPPAASTLPKPSVNSGPSRPSNLAAPGVRKTSRGMIPSFGSSFKSRTSSTTSGAAMGSSSSKLSSSKLGGAKSKVPQISSVGFKRQTNLDSSDQGSTRGSTAGRRERTSFMAPTQSSLAKIQSGGKAGSGENQTQDGGKATYIPIPTSSGLRSPSAMSALHAGTTRREPGDITNLTSPSGGRRPLPIPPQMDLTKRNLDKVANAEAVREIENIPTDGMSGLEPPVSKEPASISGGSLTRKPSHRPRISRSQVVAKLHARRLASDSSRRSSASRRSGQRKSLSGAAAGGVKATIGISRLSGAGGAGTLAAKRRMRASEVARRRSRAPAVASAV